MSGTALQCALGWSYLLQLSLNLCLIISALLHSPFALLPLTFLLPFPIGFPFISFCSKKFLKCHSHHEKSNPPDIFNREDEPCKKKPKQAVVCHSSNYKSQRIQDTVCDRHPTCMHTYSLFTILTDLQVSKHCIKADLEMFSEIWP